MHHASGWRGPVVERDRDSECGEAAGQADAQLGAGRGRGVAFEAEDVFHGE